MKSKPIIVLLLLSLIVGTVAQVAFASDASQLAVPRLVVNTSFLNVRSGPGPQYSVVVIVAGGTELPALGSNPSNSWYLVSTAVGQGWVDVTFTLPRGDFRYVPEIEPNAGATIQVQTPLTISLPQAQTATIPVPVPRLAVPHVIINTGNQNVRYGPGPQFDVLTVVAGGTSLDVLGVLGDTSWFKVRGAFGEGWVASEFVIFRGTFSNVPVIHSIY